MSPEQPKELVERFIDAVAADRAQAKDLLLAHPELLEARWIHEETLLHFLAVEGFIEGVRWLAEQGADLDATNEFGGSALADVATIGNVPMLRLLLERGANPNVSDADESPLFRAVAQGSLEVVEILLTADARARSDESLELALELRREQRVEMRTLLRRFDLDQR